VVHAVQLVRPGQAELITDTLVSTFCTDLTRDRVLSMVLLLLDQRRDLGNFLRERILQSFLSGLIPSEVLSDVTRLLGYFSEVQQCE